MTGELHSRHSRQVGIVLSAAWMALAGAAGLMHAGAKAHREAMACYRRQAEAKAAPQCAQADAFQRNPLCGMKDADCRTSLLAYPPDLAVTAGIAVIPPALVWLLVFLRRRGQGSAAA